MWVPRDHEVIEGDRNSATNDPSPRAAPPNSLVSATPARPLIFSNAFAKPWFWYRKKPFGLGDGRYQSQHRRAFEKLQIQRQVLNRTSASPPRDEAGAKSVDGDSPLAKAAACFGCEEDVAELRVFVRFVCVVGPAVHLAAYGDSSPAQVVLLSPPSPTDRADRQPHSFRANNPGTCPPCARTNRAGSDWRQQGRSIPPAHHVKHPTAFAPGALLGRGPEAAKVTQGRLAAHVAPAAQRVVHRARRHHEPRRGSGCRRGRLGVRRPRKVVDQEVREEEVS